MSPLSDAWRPGGSHRRFCAKLRTDQPAKPSTPTAGFENGLATPERFRASPEPERTYVRMNDRPRLERTADESRTSSVGSTAGSSRPATLRRWDGRILPTAQLPQHRHPRSGRDCLEVGTQAASLDRNTDPRRWPVSAGIGIIVGNEHDADPRRHRRDPPAMGVRPVWVASRRLKVWACSARGAGASDRRTVDLRVLRMHFRT